MKVIVCAVYTNAYLLLGIAFDPLGSRGAKLGQSEAEVKTVVLLKTKCSFDRPCHKTLRLKRLLAVGHDGDNVLLFGTLPGTF